MHLTADAVSHKFSNNAVTLGLAMALDSMTYISQPTPGEGGVNGFVKALFGGTKKSFSLFCHLTDTESVGRVATKSIEESAAVYRHDVAILKWAIVGDTVDDYPIDRGTNRRGKGLAPGIPSGKPLKVGTAPWSLMNCSAKVSISKVDTPGFTIFAISASVALTNWLAWRK